MYHIEIIFLELIDKLTTLLEVYIYIYIYNSRFSL